MCASAATRNLESSASLPGNFLEIVGRAIAVFMLLYLSSGVYNMRNLFFVSSIYNIKDDIEQQQSF